MPSIWDDDDDDIVKPNAEPKQAIVKANSAEIDLLQRGPVKMETENLFRSLEICDKIVVLAFEISEYMPNMTNKQMESLWNNEINPTLISILQQDVNARAIVWNAFSAVRNLAISINEGAGLVKELKGSAASVQAAQNTISNAFEKLESSIVAATGLSTNALATFEDKIGKLIHIMGANSADFVNDKVKIHKQLQEQYQKKKQLIDEIEKKKEIVEMNSNLIHVTESKIKGAEAAKVETKRRAQELDNLNKEMERNIQQISSTYHVTKTLTSSTKTSKDSYVIPNPNRNAQKQFYESIVKERIARITAINTDHDVQEAVESQLKQDLCEYKSKYKIALDSLVEHEKMFCEQMNKIQQEIDALTAQLNKVYLTESEATSSTGLQGENLQKFLELITRLKTETHQSVNIYKSLEGALTAIRAMVDPYIMLLKSKEQTDIFVAGANLLMKVAWITEYHTASCEYLKPSVEYDNIKKRHFMNAIEMA